MTPWEIDRNWKLFRSSNSSKARYQCSKFCFFPTLATLVPKVLEKKVKFFLQNHKCWKKKKSRWSLFKHELLLKYRAQYNFTFLWRIVKRIEENLATNSNKSRLFFLKNFSVLVCLFVFWTKHFWDFRLNQFMVVAANFVQISRSFKKKKNVLIVVNYSKRHHMLAFTRP